MDHGPEDGLYIFGNRTGQDTAFMCHWLHFFITVAYQKNFIRASFNYLAKKSPDIDLWAESIIDRRKQDFLILFTLNVLIETYMVVHTKGGKVWMTSESLPDDHYELLKRCDFHLAYMGCCMFIDLVQHKNLLVIVDSTEDVKTVELGCLTYDESETVDSIVFKGLGFAKGPHENTGIPFIKDLPGLTIKKGLEQETDPIPQDNF